MKELHGSSLSFREKNTTSHNFNLLSSFYPAACSATQWLFLRVNHRCNHFSLINDVDARSIPFFLAALLNTHHRLVSSVFFITGEGISIDVDSLEGPTHHCSLYTLRHWDRHYLDGGVYLPLGMMAPPPTLEPMYVSSSHKRPPLGPSSHWAVPVAGPWHQLAGQLCELGHTSSPASWSSSTMPARRCQGDVLHLICVQKKGPDQNGRGLWAQELRELRSCVRSGAATGQGPARP
jgi:hypothetical protein